MKKFVKITLLSSVFVLSSALIGLGGYFGGMYFNYSKIPLDSSALISPSSKISLFDADNRPIMEENSVNSNFVKVSQLNPYTTQAFISIEDKTFYTHNGINPKRILKATINNLKNMSFNQGASTISQQLIKNTHLSSDKTIKRKLKEIALTRKLEKNMSKNEILETYLNVIYFGNNCYGIENASNYYFSKPAKNLSLAEASTLAGMIKSPSKYSPINYEERCKNRRNLVLNEMLKDKKISPEEHLTATSSPLELNLNIENENKLNSYSESAIDEAISILKLPAKQIALAGYKIHTYQDKLVQEKLNSALQNIDFKGADNAGIVIDIEQHGITGYLGTSAYKILNAKRQPGSCIKPLLSYAPAINENIISPSTQILDEEVKIGEYAPKNVNGKVRGYVSAKESLSHSINIPAVKVLSYVGINKGKKYCEKMGLSFDEKDDSYALSLGGMTYGTNVKELASAYSTFANGGRFADSRFVSYITTKDGRLLYRHQPNEIQVLRDDSAYLMTTILQETANTGTARKLSSLGINIASKTGTVGKKNSSQNLDAWNISYTPSEICGIWCGNLDNTPISIAGGNEPTMAVKKYFEGTKSEDFTLPESVVEREIDLTELEENHRVALATEYTPERFKKTELFSIHNLPRESINFASLPNGNFSTKIIDEKINLCFDAKKYLSYKIYNSDGTLLATISEKNEKVYIPINDDWVSITTSYIGSDISSTQTIKLANKKEETSSPHKKWWKL